MTLHCKYYYPRHQIDLYKNPTNYFHRVQNSTQISFFPYLSPHGLFFCAGLPSYNELRSAGGQNCIFYCGSCFDTPGMFLARFGLHQCKRLVQATGARAGAPF